jgi:DTW domain-containing protein YfiP
VCEFVAPVDNAVEVLLLQHPLEVDEAKGTGRLLALSLARCRVVVGERFEPGALEALLHDGRRSVLLYPEVEASVATAPAVPAPGPDLPMQLVVLDATWRKSLRMLLANPALARLPRLALPADPAPDPVTDADTGARASAYARLRPARRAEQRSTLEATCAALGALEGDNRRYAPVRDGLARFVAHSLRARGNG